MPSSYPKVLIIGEQFDKQSGAGITLTNLFFGWDINNIAVAASEIYNPDFSVCNKYYCLGASEIQRGFPFNLKTTDEESVSGILDISDRQQNQSIRYKTNESKFGKIKDYLISISGQIHRRRRFVASIEFMNWVNEFSPDIIYSQLSSLELIRFVRKIHSDLGKPLVLHIMDDWPITITSEQIGGFKSYWAHVIDKELRQLFNEANVLMSISESMSAAYSSRYSHKFIPFHNPIILNDWHSHSKKDWSLNGVFRIIYTGRIGTANNQSILFISNVIDKFNQSGIRMKLDIYTSNTQTFNVDLINAFRGVEVKQALPHKSMPGLLSSYDLLLLPLDFDKEGIDFSRYSMPTKTSEYMISGTPILVFADIQTAVAKHALKYEWAYVVSENSSEKLESAIRKLYEDKELRREIGCRAKEYATNHFDSEKIRENFKKTLQNQH